MKQAAWVGAAVVAAAICLGGPAQARGFGGGGGFHGGGGFRGGGGGFRGFGGGGGFRGAGGGFRGFGGEGFRGGEFGGGAFRGGEFGGAGYRGGEFGAYGNRAGEFGAYGNRAGEFGGVGNRSAEAGSFNANDFRNAGFGSFHGPVNLPTDGGWGNHVNVNNFRNTSFNSNHITQHWGNTYINNGTINVRNNWNNWGHWHGAGGWYGPGWYGGYPGAWAAAGWVAATPWIVTPYATLASLWGLGGGGGEVPYPVNYDYGTNIVYEGDQVYQNGDPVATSQQYYQQASQLAAAGQNQPPAASTWKPLGVFGLVQPNDTSATQIFQIAVDQTGILGGNYTNVLTNTVLPIKGSVNKQTQRAAWTVGTNTSTVYGAGVYNLTQQSAPCLVHVGADSTQQWLLVRLPDPNQAGSSASGSSTTNAQ